MTSERPEPRPTIKELAMRYTPAALAIALLAAVTSSAAFSAAEAPDPRAAQLVAEGRAALEAGDVQGATDAFEAALVVDPGYSAVYLDLASAARASGMQGKAIRYYRIVLAREPENLAALAGEGEALAEKGALGGARENLAQLEALCGATCAEVTQLNAAIARGPLPRVASAAVSPDSDVSAN